MPALLLNDRRVALPARWVDGSVRASTALVARLSALLPPRGASSTTQGSDGVPFRRVADESEGFAGGQVPTHRAYGMSPSDEEEHPVSSTWVRGVRLHSLCAWADSNRRHPL